MHPTVSSAADFLKQQLWSQSTDRTEVLHVKLNLSVFCSPAFMHNCHSLTGMRWKILQMTRNLWELYSSEIQRSLFLAVTHTSSHGSRIFPVFQGFVLCYNTFYKMLYHISCFQRYISHERKTPGCFRPSWESPAKWFLSNCFVLSRLILFFFIILYFHFVLQDPAAQHRAFVVGVSIWSLSYAV